MDDGGWEQMKGRYPVGTVAEGVVERRLSFGAFVALPGVAAGHAFFDVVGYRVPAPPGYLPEPGTRVTVEVIAHTEHNRQLRLWVLRDHGRP